MGQLQTETLLEVLVVQPRWHKSIPYVFDIIQSQKLDFFFLPENIGSF